MGVRRSYYFPTARVNDDIHWLIIVSPPRDKLVVVARVLTNVRPGALPRHLVDSRIPTYSYRI